VADDWRVTIALSDAEDARRVLGDLHEREVHDEIGSRVAVSSDGPNLFLYADTRRAAEAGERALAGVLGEHGPAGTPTLERWHAVEERWEDPSVELSSDEEADRAEANDEAESIATGVAQWEVRVELDSPRAAEALAEQLDGEGLSVVRRSSYLLVGANDEDEAKELAARLGAEGTVHVEPGAGVAWQLMPRNPFAIFGGLGG
jgi:hypothetical protein